MAAAMLLERVVNLDRVIPHKTSGRAAKVCARPKIASTSCTVAPKRVSDPIRRHILAHERDRGDAVGHTFGLPFAVRRMHAHLANPRFENEPIVIEILGHATCNQVTNYQPKGY